MTTAEKLSDLCLRKMRDVNDPLERLARHLALEPRLPDGTAPHRHLVNLCCIVHGKLSEILELHAPEGGAQ